MSTNDPRENAIPFASVPPSEAPTPPPFTYPAPLPPTGKQRAWAWVKGHAYLSGCLSLIVVAVVCCGGLSAIGALGNQPNSAATPPTATAHIAAPTQAPKATATPTPKPSWQSVVTKIATEQAKDGTATNVKVVADPKTKTVTVTATVGEQLDYNGALIICKSLIFDVEHNLWTSPTVASLGGLSEVDVIVLGPTTDQYGNPSTSKYAEADLSAATAHLFNWNNLDYDTAWGDYDFTYLIPNSGS